MKTIHKFIINPDIDKLTIDAPIVRFLDAQIQRANICIWAEVDTDLADRHFVIVPIGTGWDLDQVPKYEYMTYLKTVQQYDGSLVWHLHYVELKEAYDEIMRQI